MTVVSNLTGETFPENARSQEVSYVLPQDSDVWAWETSVVEFEYANPDGDRITARFSMSRHSDNPDQEVKRILPKLSDPASVRYRITIEEIPA